MVFLVTGVCLAACSQVGSRKSETPALEIEYQRRLAQVSVFDVWSLEGRLALSDGKEGGSGALNWVQERDSSLVSFRGTMGRGAWRLQADNFGALLEMANGEVYRDTSVAELVKKHIGWKVPVDALQWWVRGLAFPGAWESRRFDDSGRLTHLEQSGWNVQFSQYQDEGQAWMPGKLTARRENYAVKVVVKAWQIGPGEKLLE